MKPNNNDYINNKKRVEKENMKIHGQNHVAAHKHRENIKFFYESVQKKKKYTQKKLQQQTTNFVHQTLQHETATRTECSNVASDVTEPQ